MKLSQIKVILQSLNTVEFILPDGQQVPNHFHITEIGLISKNFIDCGGTERNEKVINFQLWEANDFDHRLAPQKLSVIIAMSEKVLRLPDLEIEVEYQGDTIGKFGLDFNGLHFLLTAKKTACLAEDKCGISAGKLEIKLVGLNTAGAASCIPGGKCC